MGTIELSGMEFYAYHGCFNSEKEIGADFVVDLKIEFDSARAVASDLLVDTINWDAVYQMVKVEMAQRSDLLEHLAGRITNRLKEQFPQVLRSTIRIAKLNPPMGGRIGEVAFTLTR